MGASRVARLLSRLHGFSESLLFVPLLLTLAALALFLATSALDAGTTPADAREQGPFAFLVFGGGPSAASTLLASIAGTWATIAGVVYSVTLVTLQLSATKYSAQVLPTFERDRFNQIVLGMFTGTFVYALLVLKTVRDPTASSPGFVPFLGVNVAILLAISSLFLFIGFVGNLAAYMRPTRFVENLARRAREAGPLLRKPEGVEGYEVIVGASAENARGRASRTTIRAAQAGYVAHVDWPALRRALAGIERDRTGGEGDESRERVHARLEAEVGERIDEGDPLLRFWGLSQDQATKLTEPVRRAVRLLEVRQVDRDPTFAVDTLEDIAFTAMSGGATDLGVARASLGGILRIAAADVHRATPAKSFALDLPQQGPVMLERPSHRLDERCRQAALRVLDKAWSHQYWLVGETFAAAVRGLLHNAAERGGAEWEATRSWMAPVAERLFTAGEPMARARMASDLARAVRTLREDDFDREAQELEEILLQAAADRRAEDALRVLVAEAW